MIAVPEGLPSAPGMPRTAPEPPAGERRFVVVSVDATELLRPESDLLRLVEGADHIDVLLAAELTSVEPRSLGLLGGAPGPLDPDPDDDGDAPDDLVADVARLDVPDLYVHRLGLPSATSPGAEDDVVAALSELVGFDPDTGVYLLGPAGPGPGRATVQRAVQRVAQVYGIPLLRYRCLELTVVEPD